MVIKNLKEIGFENTYDIFLGKGWTNWLRVEIKPGRVVHIVKKDDVVVTNPKLLELIYYKIKKQEAKEKEEMAQNVME